MENYFATTNLPLFATEFDYFRIPREKWELMLIRLKQMGVDCLTLTIPWGFHEFNRGTVDLNGTTQARRDATGLLSLCAALECHCILRLGPYSNHGILGSGIPLWLLDQADYEAELPTAVEGWYKAASHALADKQWPHGPIIALSIDSEPTEGYTPTYSKQLTEVKWRIWLRKHYEGIEALNAVYGTAYKTVNDVEFPKTWARDKTPLEKDAREFLKKVRSDTQTRYTEVLFKAGWQIPVYPSAKEIYPELPDLQPYSLIDAHELSDLKPESILLNLQHPIQIDPVPADVGLSPVWANAAPIRADGSLRRRFWEVREFLWRYRLPKASTKGKTLRVAFGTNSLITSGSDASVRVNVPAKTNPTAYRLRLSGELVVEDQLSLKQGKLSGPYITEDKIDQTDLLLVLSDASAPIGDFPLTYLRNLLLAQMETLICCADLAEALGESLSAAQDVPADIGAPEHSVHTLNTLEEARRGLSEADAALRKAMESISGLEEGFATILDHGGAEMIPQPASAPVTISPDIFESVAREKIIKIGAVCTEAAPRLKAAATTLQKSTSAADDLTVEQYRQSYETAVAAARDARASLLKAAEQLRVEILSERLPLLGWRIHDQVLKIAESLRWGVLRGGI